MKREGGKDAGAPFIDVVYRTRYIGRVASTGFLGLRPFCISMYLSVESIMRMSRV